MRRLIERMHGAGVRVSVFVDPEPAPIDWAADLGADRIELFTEPFALAYARDEAHGKASFETYVAAAEHAHTRGLGINAGHDLDAENLKIFGALPHLDEVSIGHALISDALEMGLFETVRKYLDILQRA